jgi:2-oxoglutarate ferredoxin oxidoreductase subunit delta
MPKVEVVSELCKSCGLCINVCPQKVLKIGKNANQKGYYFIEVANPDQCIGCALCGMVCPDIALKIYK